MSDIVEHLRGSARVLHSYSVVNDCEVTAAAWPVLDRAREEIERLQAELREAREALNEIDALDPEHLIDSCAQTALRGLVLRMGEIARAALAK